MKMGIPKHSLEATLAGCFSGTNPGQLAQRPRLVRGTAPFYGLTEGLCAVCFIFLFLFFSGGGGGGGAGGLGESPQQTTFR